MEPEPLFDGKAAPEPNVLNGFKRM